MMHWIIAIPAPANIWSSSPASMSNTYFPIWFVIALQKYKITWAALHPKQITFPSYRDSIDIKFIGINISASSNIMTRHYAYKTFMAGTYESGFVGTFMCAMKRINLIVIFICCVDLTLIYFQVRYVYIKRNNSFLPVRNRYTYY